jgi:TetR/AcrR family transcriptional regulator, transcriptional repressor for nem operon
VSRPRQFDECEVLDRALQAFWEQGYDATSVEDLVTATGLGRASLYGAFGDKEQLFRRVVEHYRARSAAEMARVTAGLKGRRGLEAFLLARVSGATCFSPTAGCFLQMAGTSGTSPPLVKEALDQTHAEAHAWLLGSLQEAVALGELKADLNLERLATLLEVLVAGVTASAKAGLGQDALALAVREILELVFSRQPG